jgi:hypothetical protein
MNEVRQGRNFLFQKGLEDNSRSLMAVRVESIRVAIEEMVWFIIGNKRVVSTRAQAVWLVIHGEIVKRTQKETLSKGNKVLLAGQTKMRGLISFGGGHKESARPIKLFTAEPNCTGDTTVIEEVFQEQLSGVFHERVLGFFNGGPVHVFRVGVLECGLKLVEEVHGVTRTEHHRGDKMSSCVEIWEVTVDKIAHQGADL